MSCRRKKAVWRWLVLIETLSAVTKDKQTTRNINTSEGTYVLGKERNQSRSESNAICKNPFPSSPIGKKEVAGIRERLECAARTAKKNNLAHKKNRRQIRTVSICCHHFFTSLSFVLASPSTAGTLLSLFSSSWLPSCLSPLHASLLLLGLYSFKWSFAASALAPTSLRT